MAAALSECLWPIFIPPASLKERKQSSTTEATETNEYFVLNKYFESSFLDPYYGIVPQIDRFGVEGPTDNMRQLALISQSFIKEIRRPGNELAQKYGNPLGHSGDSDWADSEPDEELVDEPLEAAMIWIPPIDMPLEIDSYCHPAHPNPYLLNTRLIDIAINQIVPKAVKESRRRRELGLQENAQKFLDHAVIMCEHKLTCGKFQCREFRKVLEIHTFSSREKLT
ncbi:hypothetical protein M1N56_06350 [Dehalococcoidia bacterium]|nr:hypothetical protein [Dehalococcoidia bacterium]